jgi:hypothetical protein
VALEHIELSSAFDYGGLAVLRDAWERFAMVVGSRKLSNLCGSNTARVGEGRVRGGDPMRRPFWGAPIDSEQSLALGSLNNRLA